MNIRPGDSEESHTSRAGVYLGVSTKIESHKALHRAAYKVEFDSPRHQNRVRDVPEKAEKPRKIRVLGLFYVHSVPDKAIASR